MIIKRIRTTLPIDAISEVTMATFIKWVDFALGKTSIAGHKLKNPSGRYAASLLFNIRTQAVNPDNYFHLASARKTPIMRATTITFQADDIFAPEAHALEYGRGPIDLKAIMLSSSKAKVSKEGYRYRIIPIRESSTTASSALLETFRANKKKFSGNTRQLAQIAHDTGPAKFRVMSDRPGSARWLLPGIVPFSPLATLMQSLAKRLKGQIL